MNIPPTIEGLRHARNLIHKQWQKERQRADDLKIRNDVLIKGAMVQAKINLQDCERADILTGENEILKRKLKFLAKRYNV